MDESEKVVTRGWVDMLLGTALVIFAAVAVTTAMSLGLLG
jgi:hypothetical protein